MERCFGDRPARDPHQLASQGLQAILALEVSTGQTASAARDSRIDNPHGAREPDVGPGASGTRTLAQAWIQVSPRTVRKYWPDEPNDRGRRRASTPRWATFVRNHAAAMVACDFMVAVTAKFQLLYVFVILELGSRRILQCNVTAHPSAEWTLQQFREGLSGETPYRFVIHDRDAIFSADLDQELVQGFGVRVLKTPPQSPKGNAFCERLIGTIRRECLDFMIPLGERHLRRLLSEWVRHYNSGRPHCSLGPGIPAEGHRGPVRRNTVCATQQINCGSSPVPFWADSTTSMPGRRWQRS